jgi:hypothetical protein
MTLGTSLTRLGLDQRLAWWEVRRILDLANAEAAQAVEDQEFFGVDAAHARHIENVLHLLRTVPYKRSGYYEPRSFTTFERTPAPDFCRPGDVDDVDPADVPDLLGLAAVR